MSPIDAAQRTLEQHWDKTLPVNAVAVANNSGVDVYFDPSLVMSGQFTYDNEGKPVIYINPNEAKQRQRFTVFHELGHYVMGHGPSLREPYKRASEYPVDANEVAANTFAAEMIMPREAVHFYTTMKTYGLTQLAKLFWVSETAMRIRLERLGLVNV